MATTFVALLAGINVGGNRKVPMAALCEVAEELGFAKPRTYIQSGNLVVAGKGGARALETKLEAAIEEHFGFRVEVVARTADEWAALASENPFEAISATEGNRVMALVSKKPAGEGAAEGLLARGVAGEQVKATASALWVYYPNGAGTTKLTPAWVDRTIGSKVTARNWRTVVALREMMKA